MKTAAAIATVLLLSFLVSYPAVSGERSQKDAKSSQTSPADLDRYFKNMLETQKFVALGACVVKEDTIGWEGYYGYADLEAKKQLTRDVIFQLASLSKTVTTTALMQLYEQGRFGLDDDINKYLPFSVRNPNFPDKPITFRMLMTHTSSVEDVLSNGLKVPKGVSYPRGVVGDSKMPLKVLVEELFTPGGKYYSAEYFGTSEPGTKYSYSNFAFSLLGYLAERISGQDFSAYCREHIFAPLEMRNTAWRLSELDTNNVAFGYGFASNDSLPVYKKVLHFGEPGYPAGNLRTTMHDFSHFIGAMMNGGRHKDVQLLKPETVELMLTPEGVKNIPSRSFPVDDIGLTWLINDVEGAKLYSMNGFSGAIFTAAYFSPQEQIGFIFFYTGILMKNMPSMLEITKTLYRSAKRTESRDRTQRF